MNYNTFLIMFGLEPSNFKPILIEPYQDRNELTFYVEQRIDTKRQCPTCLNTKHIEVKGYYETSLRCSSNEYQTNKLIIKRIRYICKKCMHTFSPKLVGISPYSNISNNVKQLIYLDFFKRITFSDIAKKYQVSIGTVIRLFDELIPEVKRTRLPRILCIDEFHFTKNYDQNYCCIIVDKEKKYLVDILKNRRKEYLNEYFSNISCEELNEVEYFISDMYEEYSIIKKKYFPNSIHIIDRFHIVLQLTRAIKNRRTSVMKSIQYTYPMYYNFMKSNWELYEQSKYKIPNKEYKNKKTGYVYSYEYLFYKTLNLDRDLNIAYEVLQELLRKPYFTHDNDLVNLFNNIIKKLKSTTDKNIIKVGTTYEKWLVEIVNAYTIIAVNEKLTNALAENTNNHIKTLIKLSYGLQNYERTRKRAIILSRKGI